MKCIFVGDVALGDHPKSVGFGFYSRYCEGIPPAKSKLQFPPSWEHDILFGNLEFSLGCENPRLVEAPNRSCRGIPSYVDFLATAGFNVLNLANNHIYQYGRGEFEKTVELLRAQGIGIVGVQGSAFDQRALEVKDNRVLVLGWSARPRQGFVEPPPYQEFNEERCYAEIAAASENGAIVVASIHWGEEFVEFPSPEERRIARCMIDAGASLVVGHHPHAVREVEEYRNGLIAYSLGNFICDMTWNEVTRKTACLYVEFDSHGLTNWDISIGRIEDDYFPSFSPSGVLAETRKRSEGLEHDKASYELMAQQALSRHQRLTFLHMLRNSWRYPASIWWHMLKIALRARLPFVR